MDKFVKRTPSWQTITYANSLEKSRRKLQLSDPSVKKKPLRESQLQPSATKECSLRSSRRLSIRDEHLLKIFASKPDQPLVPLNEDSGLSSSSQSSLDNIVNSTQTTSKVEKQFMPVEIVHNLCELSDYVNSTDAARSQQKLFISQTPPVTFNEEFCEDNENNITTIRSDTTITAFTKSDHNALENKSNNNNLRRPSSTPKVINQHQMACIHRDMNSPSATVRLRAMKALKSNPKNSPYTGFDVPHEEQNIISEEELHPPPPPSIEELMRDIVVYVEVRTGEDNRSDGVKKVISQLGARVNDKLLRDTTHVIFKDGLLSTYKKAKNWNIPVVSILWIEACKNKRMICEPNDFPISNIDRYENPELYEKMKRHKSMQPDSECNKRIRLKQGTPKSSAEVPTRTPTSAANTPKTSKKQTDISQFFRKLANTNNTPTSDNNGVTGSTISITKANEIPESPATQLLNRIESNTFTPLRPRRIQTDPSTTTLKFEMSLKPSSSGDFSETTMISSQSKKCLQKPSSPPRSCKKPSPRKRVITRRSSVHLPVEQGASTYSLQMTETDTPVRVTRRRSSTYAAVNMSLSTIDRNAPESTMHCNQTAFSTIAEENGEVASGKNSNTTAGQKSPKSSKGRLKKRRTTYTNKTPEMSPEKKVKTTIRRTLYTPQPIEESISEMSVTKVNGTSKVLDENLLHFALTPTTLAENKVNLTGKSDKKDIETGALIEEHSATMIFSSTRLPSANRRRTLFDVSMDIIQQRLHNINNSARRSITKELTYNEKSPIIGGCKTVANVIGESNNLSTPKTNATTSVISPPKTIKKRKLFVPNDVSLILTATPPVSAKKSTAETNAKRRRTITPQLIEKRMITKPRKSIATKTKSHSEVMISPTSSNEITNQTKNSAQSVPILGNELTSFEENDKLAESSIPRKDSDQTLSGNTEESKSETRLSENQIIVNESKEIIPTATLPKLKGSFMSIISSKTSDTTVKQQLQHDLGIDENIVLDIPSATTVLDQAAADENARVSSTLDLPQSITNHAAAKFVKKSQMTATPDTAKDAVVVGATGGATGTAIQSNAAGNSKKWPYIVCTNMHREQIKVMREAISALGGLQLNHCVNDDTTHVVSYEPRRTLNLLRGLIRGLWIVDYKWVLDSLKTGYWLNEEDYELRVFSRAIEICRTERQAFGNTYKCELFADLGTFYISSRCGPISRENLKELIELCGGKVVDHRKRAKYILGDPHRTLEEKVYVTPFWVLDSITHMQVMRHQKYAYIKTSVAKPPAQTQQTNTETVTTP
ncbi:uncharacterized protein LOC101449922 isoform X2 [Ceratitis capitata]|uniref:uncharacterized protein LOC101449922 isoform X2 n=1 Tax=Ceratitis capitata TaxID=7213 RepID=UPI000618822B|nr:uncharacterized protein LOC101449922 isoform X2 [Ceratitis capitata]